ncbi:MAG: DUF4249 domain-containing protein [Calditrichaeota bacterium]|nr:MAG: DUF4249 domain-containing protein [Calditrichota bacterium]
MARTDTCVPAAVSRGIVVFISLVLIFLLSSCTKYPSTEDTPKIVIQGFLYLGEPVDDIQITLPVPVFSEDTVAPPVNDAEVVLIKNGVRYPLMPQPKREGYYYYPGSELTVEEGDKFELQVFYEDQFYRAITVVPSPPRGVRVTPERFLIEDVDEDYLTLFWTVKGQAGEYFYVLIENIDAEPKPLVFPHSPNPPREPQTSRRFVSAPFSESYFVVTPYNLAYAGRHYARVYRVNQEYADLFIRQDENPRNLSEIPTNIENGLGIFTALSASDSVFFDVQQRTRR